MLVKKGQKYDPEEWSRLNAKAGDRLWNGWSVVDDHAEDVLDLLPGHVPQYESKVDILICTPGRLVEHVQHTRGFRLDSVEWLVIDEADRLLDQSFQGWAGTVMKALEKEKAYEEMSPREKIMSRMWYAPLKRSVRKVILSATMTRDLSKLSALKLRRPTLVVAEGTDGSTGQRAQGEVYDMPSTLDECTIPVGDGSQKPLFLLHLLRNQILWDLQASEGDISEPMQIGKLSDASSLDADSSSEASDDSSSVSSEATESDSEGSASSASESDSDSSESDVSDSSESSGSETSMPETAKGENTVDAALETKSTAEPVSNVLIFTHNNENANRLSRLLSLIYPSYAGLIGTLTKSSTTSASRKVLRAFRANKLRILIASDRASRGLDLPNLTHIVNYDIPTSITSYVHRVGRTARAGAYGVAWTFLTKSEAGWFWNVVARGEGIRRGGRKVQRMKLEDAVTPETTKEYEHALETLKAEVRGREER
ncbi:RNA helicase ATP-dependent DEAD-box conserved site [Macrophomina phaseolina MS6]|uniref:ATP-dependent RNA helicase n=1 Tax=Macrophomina phaseolina (strain MS6) TaxID=1126212 RepID=K2RDB0_MACPH|nr:RNA helicase ATP-dependent DEAD-box conserved site [Macrophomina phaseolina MS6]